jgi:hypothetical protein
MRFGAGGRVTQMILKTDGKIGIGTTTPTEKLEVNGNVKADIFKGDLQGTADKIKTI